MGSFPANCAVFCSTTRATAADTAALERKIVGTKPYGRTEVRNVARGELLIAHILVNLAKCCRSGHERSPQSIDWCSSSIGAVHSPLRLKGQFWIR